MTTEPPWGAGTGKGGGDPEESPRRSNRNPGAPPRSRMAPAPYAPGGLGGLPEADRSSETTPPVPRPDTRSTDSLGIGIAPPMIDAAAELSRSARSRAEAAVRAAASSYALVASDTPEAALEVEPSQLEAARSPMSRPGTMSPMRTALQAPLPLGLEATGSIVPSSCAASLTRAPPRAPVRSVRRHRYPAPEDFWGSRRDCPEVRADQTRSERTARTGLDMAAPDTDADAASTSRRRAATCLGSRIDPSARRYRR